MPSRMAFFRAFFSVDPAHAGMNLFVTRLGHADDSGPRACGDEPEFFTAKMSHIEWTPRMRG